MKIEIARFDKYLEDEKQDVFFHLPKAAFFWD